jgi:hypothetical protein
MAPARKLDGRSFERGIERSADFPRLAVHEPETSALHRKSARPRVEAGSITMRCRAHAFGEPEDQRARPRFGRIREALVCERTTREQRLPRRPRTPGLGQKRRERVQDPEREVGLSGVAASASETQMRKELELR